MKMYTISVNYQAKSNPYANLAHFLYFTHPFLLYFLQVTYPRCANVESITLSWRWLLDAAALVTSISAACCFAVCRYSMTSKIIANSLADT